MQMKKQFLLKLYFTDLDVDNAKISAHICIDIYAFTFEHAQVLAKHLAKVHGADKHEVLE